VRKGGREGGTAGKCRGNVVPHIGTQSREGGREARRTYLTQIALELAREAQGASSATHRNPIEGETEGGREARRTYLTQIAVELAREAQGASSATHGSRDEVVEVAVGRVDQLEGAEADVV